MLDAPKSMTAPAFHAFLQDNYDLGSSAASNKLLRSNIARAGDFGALITERGGVRASLVAFDLLRLEGRDQRPRPLKAR